MTDGRAPRSPDAARFDPPVDVFRFTAPEGGWPALEAECRARADLDPAAWAGVLHHGGLWIDRRRPEPGDAIQHGAPVALYVFRRRPEVPALDTATVIARDGDLLAVDKPAWMPTNGTRASRRIGLEPGVQALLGDMGWRAVHRLDRQTSGVVLFARTGPLAGRLHRAFRERAVTKRYLAVVAPPPDETTFTVCGHLSRVVHPSHSRFALTDDADGQWSESHFSAESRTDRQAWIEARPITGRTHQLRVHLAHAGHPIEGDALYGSGWRPGGAQRTLLHARRITVPIDGRRLSFESPLPEDMRPEQIGSLDVAGQPPDADRQIGAVRPGE